MSLLSSQEQLFFSRTLESSLLNTTNLLQTHLDLHARKKLEVTSKMLQCGTVLARAKGHVPLSEQCHNLLSQLYTLTTRQDSDLAEGAGYDDRIHQLQFLVAYAQYDPASTSVVANVVKSFVQQDEATLFPVVTPDTPQKRRFNIPADREYNYLMCLIKIWQLWHDAEAYKKIERYCVPALQKQPYNEICCCHRWIGILTILPSCKEISTDILLQHFFRNNFLRSVLKNDPWRFIEQTSLYLSTFPDIALSRFFAAMLLQLIEKHAYATHYTNFSSRLNTTLTITNVLLLFLKFCQRQSYSEQDAPLDTHSRSIWETNSVLQITDGTLLPTGSKSKQYSMGTFIFDQIIPETLFIATDNNWGGKYRSRHNDTAKPFSRGAAGVITSQPPEKISETQQFIAVRNTYTAMLKLALENRKRYRGSVIGITGSVGKTTTASMLHDILSHFGKSYKNISYFNHETGVPKSVANIPLESDYAVLEMGMGQPGSILPKTCLARPHVVVVTEIQHDHMEFHDTIDSIIETKLEIIDGAEQGTTVVLNRDSQHYAHMLGITNKKGATQILTFGAHPLADVRANCIRLFPDCSEIDIEIGNEPHHYKLSLPGLHMALNSLAVCAVLHALRVDIETGLLHFQALQPASGRNEVFDLCLKNKRNIRVVDDSFNANPASMRSSFHVLSLMKPTNNGRRIMVIGDMGELGEKAKQYHEELADDINCSKIDIFYCTGEYAGHLNKKISDKISHQHFKSHNELSTMLLEILQDGDILSFKGSARTGDMNKIITVLKQAQDIQGG